MTILKCCSLIARGLRAIFFGEELAAIEETLKGLALPLAEARNMFLVGILVRQVQKRQIIQIFADTDSGISIGECAEFSRTLADLIEERNLIDGPYELEVSSPGLEQPLISIRQYPEKYRAAAESALYREWRSEKCRRHAGNSF